MALSEAQQLRQRIAGRRRHDPTADVEDLQAEMPAAKIEAYIRRAVASAPPLTAEQRDRLAAIFRGGGGHG